MSPPPSPRPDDVPSTQTGALVFAGLTVVMAAMAVLGIPPFFPNGTGPVDGLGRLANILFFPFFLAPVGGLVASISTRRLPTLATASKVMLVLLALTNLAIAAFTIWAMINTPRGSVSPSRVVSLWIFGATALVAAALGVSVTLKRRR